jgi:hypothetical protein
MTYQIESGKTVGLYVPSYKRYDKIKTAHIIDGCKYVVRESEVEQYRQALPLEIEIVMAPDEQINSLGKVRQWIIDNTEEDIVIQLDDDIEKLVYELKINYEPITDKEIVISELLRIAQIIDDLGLGMGSMTMTIDVRKHCSEFIFKGCIGIICWFNKECLKSKYETEIINVDIDNMLQELLHNRIIIIPDYMGVLATYDKNAGGNNTNKTKARLAEAHNYLKNKWGKHIDFNYKTNQVKIDVKR